MMKESIQGVKLSQAISLAFSNYANFEGRSSRSEYWLFALAIALVILITSVFLIVFAINNVEPAMISMAVILGIIELTVLIPSLAVTVRRLHDINKSGWWYLIAFIPLGGIVLLIFTLTPSFEGNNKYGGTIKSDEKSFIHPVQFREYMKQDIPQPHIKPKEPEVIYATKKAERFVTDNPVDKYPELKLQSTIGRNWKLPLASKALGVLAIFVSVYMLIFISYIIWCYFFPDITVSGYDENGYWQEICIDQINNYKRGFIEYGGYRWNQESDDLASDYKNGMDAYDAAVSDYRIYLIIPAIIAIVIFLIAAGVLLFLYKLLHFRKGRKKLCDVADYISDYKPLLIRKEYYIFIKDNKFGLLENLFQQVIVEPRYDKLLWKNKEFLYAERDGQRFLVHVPSGKELK